MKRATTSPARSAQPRGGTPRKRRGRRPGRGSPAARVDAAIGQARAALADGDWSRARDRFENALSHGETPEILEGLGWALWWLDEVARSFDFRERAFRAYRRQEDRQAAARVAISLAVDAFDYQGAAVTSGWLERAQRLLAGLEPGPEIGWLALWRGHFARVTECDTAAARIHAAQAAAVARDHGLPDLELLARALDGLLMVGEGRIREGMRRLDEATASAVAGEIANLDAVVAACCFLVYACERVRDYERAAQWAARVEGLSRRWRVPTIFALCRTQHVAMRIGLGEWTEAEKELTQTTDVLKAHRPFLLAGAIVQLGELRRRQGRFEEAEALFTRSEGLSLAILGRAWIVWDRGELAEAADLAERYLRQVLTDNWTGKAAGLALLADARCALGLRTEAERAATDLREIAGRVDVPAVRGWSRGADGALSAAKDEMEAARRAREDSVDLFERSRAPFEAARARIALAEVLARSGRPGPAAIEAGRAAEAARRLGAAFEAGRANRLLESLRPRAASDPVRPILTPREVEILRLIARGLGDKEVAARLRLSEHTVHRHVSNILSKLDVPTRVAAVAQAIVRELL